MDKTYLIIALPKGRIGEKAMQTLEDFGIYDVVKSASRKLIFTDEKRKMKYIFVKAADVVTYVEAGVADLGIVGSDIILEADAEIYEILDLKFGQCKFSIAGFEGTKVYKKDETLKVATKYPHVTRTFFEKQNQPIDIITLSGSVELGPVIGLSEVIVDIVETGKTLRANGLTVLEDIESLSAKLIANPASYRIKRELISTITNTINKESGSIL